MIGRKTGPTLRAISRKALFSSRQVSILFLGLRNHNLACGGIIILFVGLGDRVLISFIACGHHSFRRGVQGQILAAAKRLYHTHTTTKYSLVARLIRII